MAHRFWMYVGGFLLVVLIVAGLCALGDKILGN